ncbi:MAG TPA: copper homeostasis protein CutC [Terriglobales bacterium]|nr:copper homeostasis protein CutC [Terriglobales bacterium]
MPNHSVLEICVESVDRAVAAERGGADRIELCCDLSSGGVTPSAGLMKIARKNLRIPIFVLIRPRRGNFVYSKREFETMAEDIDTAKQLGIDGIVLGLLNAEGEVEVGRTRKLVEIAHPLPVTFHHAFDVAPDLQRSLTAVMKTGAKRILTSGGKPRAAENLSGLARLVSTAKDRISIMPGGGINARNVTRISRQTLAHEIHTSLGTSSPQSSNQRRDGARSEDRKDLGAFEKRVRELVDLLAADGSN